MFYDPSVGMCLINKEVSVRQLGPVQKKSALGEKLLLIDKWLCNVVVVEDIVCSCQSDSGIHISSILP